MPLGKVFEAANRIDDAAELYQDLVTAIAEGPDLLQAKVRLAVVKTRQQELATARTLVEEVLQESSRNTEALTLRGTLLLNDGDAAGAIADFRTVLRDEPKRLPAVRLLARAHLTNKEPELARDVLKQGLENSPDAAVLALDLANYYAARSRLDEALSALDGVLAHNANDGAALEGKFKILVYRKQFEQASEVAEQLKRALPEGVKGFHFAGLIRQAQGDFEASIGEFQSRARSLAASGAASRATGQKSSRAETSRSRPSPSSRVSSRPSRRTTLRIICSVNCIYPRAMRKMQKANLNLPSSKVRAGLFRTATSQQFISPVSVATMGWR